MTREEVLKRAFPVLVTLILLVLGYYAGLKLTEFFLSAHKCLTEEGRYITGGLGTLTTLISLIFGASDTGFLRIGSLYSFLRHGEQGTKDDYHWFSGGVLLGLAAFALSGLLSFSLGAAFRTCPPPPECVTSFPMCKGERTERDCWLCNVQAGIPVVVAELRAARKDIARLHLDRVGAFPLLFQNAGTVGGKLSREGVELAPGQLASWHRNLFASASWPDAATKNVAHCVVAYSSTARFQGKPKEASDELNVQAAGCRADSVAKELGTVLDEPTPVASCRWSSYDAMTRPHLQPDGHLATPDRQLISRSAFVHGFRLSEEKLSSIQEGGFDVGEACDEWMAKKLGVESSTLACSTVDGEPPDGNGCPPNAPNPPNPEQEDG